VTLKLIGASSRCLLLIVLVVNKKALYKQGFNYFLFKKTISR